MSEKFIIKAKNKKGYSLRVVIRVNGKSKNFGTFNRADYVSDKLCMEAAKLCRDQALMDIRNNRIIIHEVTVQEAFDTCLDSLVTNVKTRERYLVRYRTSVPEKIRIRKLSSITIADLQKMLNTYADRHATEEVKRIRSMWSQIYKASMLSGAPLADLSQMVTIPKGRKPVKKRPKFCTLEEYEQFMEGLLTYQSDPQTVRDIYLAFRIMQYLGLRPQEAFALRRADIDLVNDKVSIRQSIGSTNANKRAVVALKTAESVRDLPIPDELVPYLEELLGHDSDPLFVARDGLPYEIDYVDTFVYNARISKKLPTVTMYMMRHLFADDITKQDLKLAQSMMGHASAEMSLQYANAADLDDMREALQKRFS
jgi:integrase